MGRTLVEAQWMLLFGASNNIDSFATLLSTITWCFTVSTFFPLVRKSLLLTFCCCCIHSTRLIQVIQYTAAFLILCTSFQFDHSGIYNLKRGCYLVPLSWKGQLYCHLHQSSTGVADRHSIFARLSFLSPSHCVHGFIPYTLSLSIKYQQKNPSSSALLLTTALECNPPYFTYIEAHKSLSLFLPRLLSAVSLFCSD